MASNLRKIYIIILTIGLSFCSEVWFLYFLVRFLSNYFFVLFCAIIKSLLSLLIGGAGYARGVLYSGEVGAGKARVVVK